MQRSSRSLAFAGKQAASPSGGSGPRHSRGMGSCQSAPEQAGEGQGRNAEAARKRGPRAMAVEKKTRPPQRLEGGGFKIVDIMSGFSAERLDPFLIWHELPRAFHRPGEMPGAPMHPHRGFCECPYAKEMVGKDGPSDLDAFIGRDHANNKVLMRSGDFEFGQVGQGFEHEGLVDPRWTGTLHFFQLWINLPRKHKMDPPRIINCAAGKLPVVELSSEPRSTVKVLLGEDVFGATSPVKSPHVPAQYLDVELAVGAVFEYAPPPEMQTRLLYVYLGEATVGGAPCKRGEFVVLGPGDQLEVLASGREGAGILFLAGRRIGEPVVQHGPFVMTTREEIQKCFSDYQRGLLCGKMTRDVIQ